MNMGTLPDPADLSHPNLLIPPPGYAVPRPTHRLSPRDPLHPANPLLWAHSHPLIPQPVPGGSQPYARGGWGRDRGRARRRGWGGPGQAAAGPGPAAGASPPPRSQRRSRRKPGGSGGGAAAAPREVGAEARAAGPASVRPAPARHARPPGAQRYSGAAAEPLSRRRGASGPRPPWSK